jgi:hypothetical protein
VLHYQAKNNKVEEPSREVLVIERAELGEKHINMLTSMNNIRLANLHLSQKRFAEAEEMHRQVLCAREKHQNADHPETLLAVIGLGYAVQSQRWFGKAVVSAGLGG